MVRAYFDQSRYKSCPHKVYLTQAEVAVSGAAFQAITLDKSIIPDNQNIKKSSLFGHEQTLLNIPDVLVEI